MGNVIKKVNNQKDSIYFHPYILIKISYFFRLKMKNAIVISKANDHNKSNKKIYL